MNRSEISNIMDGPYRNRPFFSGFVMLHAGAILLVNDPALYWAWIFIVFGALSFCRSKFSILLFRANKNLKIILLGLLVVNTIITNVAFRYGLEEGLVVPFIFYVLFGLLLLSDWEDNIFKKYGC